jgi:UDP-N-acetylmuramoylalanine--D-glutamate ligase
MLLLNQKKITILGAQKSGLAVARLARKHGAYVKLSELKPKEKIAAELLSQLEAACNELEFGNHSGSFVGNSDLVILSPGVRFDAPILDLVRHKKILIMGEIEFAFQFCKAPVIAVTGSNGKTTTTTLINSVLNEAGYRSQACGNIGLPFSEAVLGEKDNEFFVLEVSSFQMESLLFYGTKTDHLFKDFKWFRPYIAVVLNVSENHLDRHEDIDEYFSAKTKIFQNQNYMDFAVVNARDPRLNKLIGKLQARVVQFNEKEKNADGFDTNQQAVAAVAKIIAIDKSVCKKVFKEFNGVEHRMEKVRTINSVTFINDSKSTTAESGRWALEHLDRPVIMICGGRDKHIDFGVLRDLVKSKVKKMITIGEAKDKLKETFESVVTVDRCDSLENAVKKAKAAAKTGEFVLFSPMCASFDMFENFEHRGKVFKDIVNEL